MFSLMILTRPLIIPCKKTPFLLFPQSIANSIFRPFAKKTFVKNQNPNEKRESETNCNLIWQFFTKRCVEILGFAKTVSKKHGDGYIEDFRGSLMRKFKIPRQRGERRRSSKKSLNLVLDRINAENLLPEKFRR